MGRPLHTICTKCGGSKETITVNVYGVTKTRSRCMPCHSTRSYASRKKRAPLYNALVRDRVQSDIDARAYIIWKRAKDRAKKYGYEFSLTRDSVISMLKHGFCSVTGIKFDLQYRDDKMNPFSPSLDKIDPKQGYIDGNVRMVCWIYNRAKGDGTDADVMLLVEAINAINISKAA